MSNTQETITLTGHIQARSVVFRSASGEPAYAYGDAETSEVMGPVRLSDIRDNGEERWFVFYVADCFAPPLYAVNARSFAAAYEEFIDWKSDLIRISDEELKDYNLEDVHYSIEGYPVDTDLVMGFEVWIHQITA
jgi:hypothetical protein